MGGFVFVFSNGWEEAIVISALAHRRAHADRDQTLAAHKLEILFVHLVDLRNE